MEVIKAVVFDLWDTLVPSTIDFIRLAPLVKGSGLSRSEFVTRYERAVQMKKYKNFKELHRDFLRAFQLEGKEIAEGEFFQVYLERSLSTKFFPEVLQTFKELKKNKIKLGLLSNTENIITKGLEESLALSSHFDAVCYSFDICALKPEPIAFNAILKKLKVKPSEALMVGDSLRSDVSGAKNIGMHSCLINRSGKVYDIADVTPDFAVKSLKEVPVIVRELNAEE